MPAWVRLKDINNVGAPVIGAVAETVIINDKPAALYKSVIASHPTLHNQPTIIQGSRDILVEGKPPAFVGALEACGHSQAQGSPDVIISGA